MIDFKKLTDAEVAYLTYATETYNDHMREGDEKNDAFMQAANDFGSICTEYHRRKLDYKQFLLRKGQRMGEKNA